MITEKIPIWSAEGRKDCWIIEASGTGWNTIQLSKRRARREMKEDKIFKRNTLKLSLFSKHGEKSTKYFLNVEKRNHIKKHMWKLNINGTITTDPFNILNEQRRFYQELYTGRNKNDEAISIPKLSEEQKMSCFFFNILLCFSALHFLKKERRKKLEDNIDKGINKNINTRLPKVKLFQLSDCKSFSHFIKSRFSFFFSLARYSSILKVFLRCAGKAWGNRFLSAEKDGLLCY